MLTIEQVMKKSANRLAGLNPIVRAKAEELIVRAWNAGVQIVIVQGFRSPMDQAKLYAQGRTTSGPIVTKAPPGHSYHEYGLAVDFALLRDSGEVSWNTKEDLDKDGQRDWMEVVAIAKQLGFEWGGDFTTITDMPHLEYAFGLTIKQLIGGEKPPTFIAKPPPSPDPAAPAAVTVMVNGQRVSDGYLQNGRAMVPLRDVVQAAGLMVSRTAAGVTINGEPYRASDDMLVAGKTFVPLRSICDVLGAEPGWDNSTKTATITL